MVLEDISRAPLNKDTPVYVERFPDGKFSAVVMLDRRTGKTAGWAATFYENGTPELVGRYKDGDLDGPLRLYDDSGELVLYAEYKSGRANGLRILLGHEWPLLVQQWKGGTLGDQCVIVGDWAISPNSLAADVAAMPLAREDLRARIDRSVGRAVEIETELRRSVRQWFLDVVDAKRKGIARARGPAIRNSIVREAEEISAANAAAFDQSWRQMMQQLQPRLLGK